MVEEETFLGRGWGFPIEFDPVSKRVRMVSEEDDIRESLRLLIGTRPGERIMQPGYGCGLHALVFDSINDRMLSDVREVIEHAILFFEPRISLEKVDVDTGLAADGLLRIRIEYRIRSTNTRSNIVYPFYFREGTNVRL